VNAVTDKVSRIEVETALACKPRIEMQYKTVTLKFVTSGIREEISLRWAACLRQRVIGVPKFLWEDEVLSKAQQQDECDDDVVEATKSARQSLLSMLADHQNYSSADLYAAKADVFLLGDKGVQVDVGIAEAMADPAGEKALFIERGLPSAGARHTLEHSRQQLTQLMDGMLMKPCSKSAQAKCTAVRGTVAGMTSGHGSDLRQLPLSLHGGEC